MPRARIHGKCIIPPCGDVFAYQSTRGMQLPWTSQPHGELLLMADHYGGQLFCLNLCKSLDLAGNQATDTNTWCYMWM